MVFHSPTTTGLIRPPEREDTFRRISMPEGMVMRHRARRISPMYRATGYLAGYYSHVVGSADADGFAASGVKRAMFSTRFLAQRLGDFVYSVGKIRDPLEAYVAFRGREPDPQAQRISKWSRPRRPDRPPERGDGAGGIAGFERDRLEFAKWLPSA